MTKTFIRATAILLMFMLLVPFLAALPVFAAEESEEEDVDMWEDVLIPAYMGAEFQTIEDRIKGDTVISPMDCKIVSNGYALYVDSKTGEVVVLSSLRKTASISSTRMARMLIPAIIPPILMRSA